MLVRLGVPSVARPEARHMIDDRDRPNLLPLPLVGRAQEQAVLRRALRAVLAGRGRLVAIGGEAGIGKTALVDHLGAVARQLGARVITSHCYDLSVTPPYGPWLALDGGVSRLAREQPTLPAQ